MGCQKLLDFLKIGNVWNRFDLNVLIDTNSTISFNGGSSQHHSESDPLTTSTSPIDAF